jgi:hypothetical protein
MLRETFALPLLLLAAPIAVGVRANPPIATSCVLSEHGHVPCAFGKYSWVNAQGNVRTAAAPLGRANCSGGASESPIATLAAGKNLKGQKIQEQHRQQQQ